VRLAGDLETRTDPHAAAWRRYLWWSRAFWLLFFAYLPAVALVDRLVRRTHGDAANTTTLVMALVWMIAFAVVGYYKSNFACPRCGETFFRAWDDRPWRKSWRSNPFARRCLHCGLPKWSDTRRG
jgi:hypothetical protein